MGPADRIEVHRCWTQSRLAATSFRFGRPGIQLVNSRGFDQTLAATFFRFGRPGIQLVNPRGFDQTFLRTKIGRVFRAPPGTLNAKTACVPLTARIGLSLAPAGQRCHISLNMRRLGVGQRRPRPTQLSILAVLSLYLRIFTVFACAGSPVGRCSREVPPEGECE